MGREYPRIVRAVRERYGVRVRRWRGAMSGCAWRVDREDGRVTRWVESPRPRTPVSLAVFLHEVGHHVIGFERFARGCEEEYHAWEWALSEMRRVGVEPDERTLDRVERSMRYAVYQAERRGSGHVPVELKRYSVAA